MDISKVERQAPSEGRSSVPPNYIKILLQDMICFFILVSLALLIVAGILYVADDVTRLPRSLRDRLNTSRAMSADEGHKHNMHRFLRPDIWFRLFNCQKQDDARMLQLHEKSQIQEPMQEQGQEQVLGEGEELEASLNEQELDEQQRFGPYFVPTYGPYDHPENNRLQAAGDHVMPLPTDNQLEPEPKPSFESF